MNYVQDNVKVVKTVQSGNYYKSSYTPFCYQSKTRSNCSERVAIANHLLQNERKLLKAGFVSNRAYHYYQSKLQDLDRFHHVTVPGNSWYDERKKYFFVTATHDEFFESQKHMLRKEKNVQILNINVLMIIDNINGCCHDVKSGVTFIKIPRTWAVGLPYNVYKDVTALRVCLKGHRLKRGNSHLDVCQNYRTFGMYCSRNSAQVLRSEHSKKCR